ncbi:phospholipase D-like domain-containing protein [Variovorax paradoxus]|uniref:Phospholipase D/transphosphatidylase n=1 Tax=Variovorax paradoxus (strain EPS) TaxID=595537 RepID=E6V5F2_VARPE|nr:phospholipase D-like domain-containing protein [Variovorax paradoxus]ADU34758.1 phospholipase D/transphosphatidylase [Variovorax paradoxus EPS]
MSDLRPTNDTQHRSTVPLCAATGAATGSAQWFLEKRGEDEKTPVFHHNNLRLYICGEETFKQIATDIRRAQHSIDLVCWGFDPAMELTRETADQWPRGDTWGDLLLGAAQGKFNNGKPVNVRLLVWYDFIGSAAVNNMPGYKTESLYERSKPGLLFPPSPSERDRREIFNSHWYRDVVAGKQNALSLRTRGGVHDDVMTSLRSEASMNGLGRIERLGFEYLATHHQKTIVIDYEGDKPCGYVLGLNSVTDYWDTTAHKFDDPRRGKSWEGANDAEPGLKPYQDYGCRVEGQVLAAVCKNFTEAWNKAEGNGKGAGSNVSREFNLKATPANLTRNLVAPHQSAQILRTLPATDGSEKSIHRLYNHAISFARHYLYVENQYFQHAAWVKELKRLRGEYLAGFQKGKLGMADVPKLHVMVLTPTPERKQMVPRTHDTVTELGHGSSMPNQTKLVEEEIARYDAVQEARRRSRDPLMIPPPQPLSSIAQAYKDAGGGKDDEMARKALEGQFAMRSLVASLWTFDTNWQTTQRDRLAKLDGWKKSANYDPNSPGYAGGINYIKDLENQLLKARYREIYIHSKLMVIDDSMFTLGSANLNLRSFAVDSEINIASDDPVTAKNLRERVWGQHTDGKFAGGVATDQTVMAETFKNWRREAYKNFKKKALGEAPSCFLVAFHDDRASSIRLG